MTILFNKTALVAELIPLIDAQGRNVAVIIAKATYSLLPDEVAWAEDPQPLYLADEFTESERDAAPMRLASDLAFEKPATDVVIVQPPGDLRRHPFVDRQLAVKIGSHKFSGVFSAKWPFGPVARDQSPRQQHAGTYDAAWAANRMPLLPVDFDPQFNQVAPPQQIVSPYLNGDEKLRLEGFAEDGQPLETRLPGRTMLVAANASGRYFTERAVLDTLRLHLEPLTMEIVWRFSIPTRRKIEEVRYVWIYYPTLRSVEEVYGTQ